MGLRPKVFLPLALAWAAGCGSGGKGSTIARIEIRPASLLLTSDRPEAALEAVALDADGNEVDADFTWASSKPDQVAVDAVGTVAAQGGLGSAAVWAEADGVRSPPAVVANVELRPGSLVVTDAQVVEIGQPFLPEGAAADDFPQVDVRLRDVAPPAAGTIVVSAESSPVGGAVVSADQDGDEVVVRLQSVALPELFARYDIDWQVDLSGHEVEEDAPEERASRPGPLPAEQKIEKKWPKQGAFQCSASVRAFLEKNFVDLKLGGDAKFIFKSSRLDESLPPGYLKVAIEGPLTLTGSLALRLKAGFQATAKCELKGRIRIALGAFAVAVSPAIPLGVGVSLDGKITATTLELGFEGENGFDIGVGFECGPGTTPCKALDKFEPINKFKPLLEVPSGMKDMRVELNARAYFLTGLDLLFGLGLWTVEAVEVTFGPVQAAKFASVDNQAGDASYASNYDLKIEGKLSPGGDVDKAIKKLLGKNDEDGRLGLEFTVARDISKSPVGTMTVDKSQTPPRRKVNFTVNLDAGSVVYYLLGYNVRSIEFYRKRDDAPVYEHMKSVEASASNQTEFKWQWTPTDDDVGTNEFFAFVKTSLPVIELEIAAQSSRKVEVLGICSGVAGFLRGGGGCELNGTMSHTMVVSGPATSVNQSTSASVRLQQDPDSPPGLLTFRPYGAWTGQYSATSSGCTVTVSPSPLGGSLSGDPSQGTFFVYTGDEVHEPDHYHGFMATGLFPVTTTMTCPGAEPFVQDQQWDHELFSVFEQQTLFLDPDTRRAVGTYTTEDAGGGTTITHTWTWDLVLSGEAQPSP